MSSIIFIDHFSQTPDEPGNNRFLYLADILVERGHDVTIITTDFSHKYKKTRNLTKNEISKLKYQYVMLSEPGYKKNVSVKRIYSHYIFGKNLRKYLRNIKRPDVIYISVPSLNAGSEAVRYCRSNNVPLIVDIQDLWPEAFSLVLKIPILSNIIFWPMKRQADRIYRNANKIIAVSDTYLKRGLKVNKIDKEGLTVFLGTDLEKFDLAVKECKEDKSKGEYWIGYVGTLGHSYDIEIVLKAMAVLKEHGYNNVVFKIMGDGPLMEKYMKIADKLKVRAEFVGRIDYVKMAGMLSLCDIAVNPITKGAAQSIINKHGDYAAAGIPVVSTQECEEYRKLLSDYECGFSSSHDDCEELAINLERLIDDEQLRVNMGKNSRKLAEELFDRRFTNANIIKLIEDYSK